MLLTLRNIYDPAVGVKTEANGNKKAQINKSMAVHGNRRHPDICPMRYWSAGQDADLAVTRLNSLANI